MKKFVLISNMALTVASSAFAGLPQRATSIGLKKLNRQSPKIANIQQSTPLSEILPVSSDAERPADAIDLPFKHPLTKGDASLNLYTVVDSNGDGKTWKLGGLSSGTVCMTALEGAADDWLLSVPVFLEAGKAYRVTIDGASGTATGKTERIEIKYGLARRVEAMTETAFPEFTFGGTTAYTTFDNDFTPTASGYYYFGIHCLTVQGEGSNTKVANFGISEATARVIPPVAGELKYTVAPKGELKANVTYIAPTKNQQGGDLEKITKVLIKTNWVDSHTFDSITPGQVIEFETDLNSGPYNRIEAIAYVDDKAGESAVVKDFYAGLDNPQPVKNLKIKLAEDYKSVTLSWDPVDAIGEKGGYVPTDRVEYYVFDAFGSYYDPAITSTTETSVTLDLSSLEGQDFVAYQVTAGYDETFYSVETASEIVVAGVPDQLPFHESFANGNYSQLWAVDPESDNQVYNGTVNDNELQTNADDYEADPVYLNSHDADNGFFMFMPMAKDAKYGFFSVKIDISKAEKPVLEFFAQGKGSQFDALVARDGGEFKVVKGVDFMAEPTQDWTLYRADLSEFKDAKYIQIELRITAKDNTDEAMWSVPVDNIRVIDLAPSDVRLAAISAPTSVNAGDTVKIQSVVENIGTNPLENVDVALSANNKNLETKSIATLAPGQIAKVEFEIQSSATSPDELPLNIQAAVPGDKSDNNKGETVVKVKHSSLPQVTDLTTETLSNGKVMLSWTKPDFAELVKPRTVEEGFESSEYPLFAKDGFGDWKVFDADGKKTYTFLKDTENPYRTAPMAFQLYTPAKSGMPEDYLIDMPTHSGETMLVAFSAQGQNDNWLISPLLSGNPQELSFFARSFSIGYPESFEVYYSTSGTAVEDFTNLLDVENYPANGAVAEEWTEYKAALPEGAKYFAIRHTANDTYALCLDDFKFEAAGLYPADLSIEGYRVYRNHACVNSESLVTSTQHLDSPDKGKHQYHVSAQYNHGESRAVMAGEVDVVAGIDDLTSNIRIRVSKGMITIQGAKGLPVSVSDAAGILTGTTQSAPDLYVVPATPGLYLIRIADSTHKLLVK